MSLGQRTARHETVAAARTAGVKAEDYWDFKPGQKVMTADGFAGVVASVDDGPVAGSETYIVTLDNGLGGGQYTASLLRAMPRAQANVDVKTAADDYPELGSILEDRPPLSLSIASSLQAQASVSDDFGDDEREDTPDCTACGGSGKVSDRDCERCSGSGEEPLHKNASKTCPDCNGDGEYPTHQNYWGQWDTKPCPTCNGEGEVDDNHKPDDDDSHRTSSLQGEAAWGRSPATDQSARVPVGRARCEGCGWQGERQQVKASLTCPSCDADSVSLGDRNYTQYPDARQPSGYGRTAAYNEGDPSKYTSSHRCPNCGSDRALESATGVIKCEDCGHEEQNGQADGWTKQSHVIDQARKKVDDFLNMHVRTPPPPPPLPDDLRGLSVDISGLWPDRGRAKTKAQDHGRTAAADHNWRDYYAKPTPARKGPPGANMQTCLSCGRMQPADHGGVCAACGTQMVALTPKDFGRTAGRDPFDMIVVAATDPEFRFHVTASYADVRSKAKRLRSEGRVNIISVQGGTMVANVKGDHAVYETEIVNQPGKKAVAQWHCGCKWGAYAWGRQGSFKRFEGRLCSHALALHFEAQSQGMFGRQVTEEQKAPDWLRPRTRVVVDFDRDDRRNVSRPAQPRKRDYMRTYAMVQTAESPVSVLVSTALAEGISPEEILVSLRTAGIDARGFFTEARLPGSDPDKKHHRHKGDQAPCARAGCGHPEGLHGDNQATCLSEGCDCRKFTTVPSQPSDKDNSKDSSQAKGNEKVAHKPRHHTPDHLGTWPLVGGGYFGGYGSDGLGVCSVCGDGDGDGDDGGSGGDSDGGGSATASRRTAAADEGEDPTKYVPTCQTCGEEGQTTHGGKAETEAYIGTGYHPAGVWATHKGESDHPFAPKPKVLKNVPLRRPYQKDRLTGYTYSADHRDDRRVWDQVTHAPEAHVMGERWANSFQGAPKPPGRLKRMLQRGKGKTGAAIPGTMDPTYTPGNDVRPHDGSNGMWGATSPHDPNANPGSMGWASKADPEEFKVDSSGFGRMGSRGWPTLQSTSLQGPGLTWKSLIPGNIPAPPSGTPGFLKAIEKPMVSTVEHVAPWVAGPELGAGKAAVPAIEHAAPAIEHAVPAAAHAIGDAASSAGHAVGDAAKGAEHAISDLFGHGPKPKAPSSFQGPVEPVPGKPGTATPAKPGSPVSAEPAPAPAPDSAAPKGGGEKRGTTESPKGEGEGKGKGGKGRAAGEGAAAAELSRLTLPGMPNIPKPDYYRESAELIGGHGIGSMQSRSALVADLLRQEAALLTTEDARQAAAISQQESIKEQSHAPIDLEATLHDGPEAALPQTDGADPDAEVDPDGDVEGLASHGSVEDIVAQFQRTAGAALMSGSGTAATGGEDDVAAAAKAFLQTEAMKTFSPAEQRSIIDEGKGVTASNLDRLDIAGTHYESLEAALAKSSLEDDDDLEL